MDDAASLLKLIDLTALNDHDSVSDIQQLCLKALNYHTAAVCIFPAFVGFAKKTLAHTDIKVATVINFPHGTHSIEQVLEEITFAKTNGADEIDVVFPFEAYLVGRGDEYADFIKTIKKNCGDLTLKMIIETGALLTDEHIIRVSELCIEGEANFIKTSTGKIAQGATLHAAEVILQVIKTHQSSVGIKISGGIRTAQIAEQYVALAKEMMGDTWVNPRNFRIGASGLVDVLVSGL